MAAKIISGTEVAKQIRQELAKEVAALKEKHNVVPGLVTILVGQNPASVSYVTGKQKTAKELGFYSIQDNQPEDIARSQASGADRQIQPGPEDPRNPGPAPPAETHQRDQSPLCHRPQEGRGCLSSGERGETDDRGSRLPPLHPGGDPATSHPLGGEDRRGRSGGPGTFEHRGQAHRQYPAPEAKRGQRHRNHLPHGNAGYCLSIPDGRTSSSWLPASPRR